MDYKFQRQTEVAVNRHGVFARREFLKGVSLASVAAGTAGFAPLVALNAGELRKRGMACILLFLQGGPSQFETFDPKPGHEHGGETKAIDTKVPGIQIADRFPELAKVSDKLSFVRSMSTKEGNHPRAVYLMHTGYIPSASVKYPTLGSLVAHELGSGAAELPAFVRIGDRAGSGAGFLGVQFDPFGINDPTGMPANTAVTTTRDRFEQRLGLLSKLEAPYAAAGAEPDVREHQKLYAKAASMILSPQMQAFDLAKEKDADRDAYGRTQFGSACLLARRLVESGVTFVEVVHRNWDTHQDNFDTTKKLAGEIDRPFAQLLSDLSQRGMLDTTLVLCTGEFGRTPKINPRGGRDHYPKAFNMALAGGGIRGGQVIGSTDAGGTTVKDRPVSEKDLFQTVCKSLKIKPAKENMSPIGRPIKVVDGGTPINELFG